MKLQNLSKVLGRTGLKVKKASPELLLGVGVVSIVAGTIMACKATLKVEEVLDTHADTMEKIEQANESADIVDYSERDYKKDMAITYVQTGSKIAKLYAPAVILTTVGIGCVLGSHNILHKRNLAVIAAYKGAEEAFAKYRERVVTDLGIDKDRYYRYGVKQEVITVEEIDEKGKKKKVKQTVEVLDPEYGELSQYARFFEKGSSTQWDPTPEYNVLFIKAQQNYANDRLNARGHLFLNEVYDMLGFPRTAEGAIVGWVVNEGGDNYVDFCAYKKHGSEEDINNLLDFVDGDEPGMYLDFNVDGIIYDLI